MLFLKGHFLTCGCVLEDLEAFCTATAGWCVAAHGYLIWLIYAMPHWARLARFKY